MNVTTFVTAIQRVEITIEEAMLPLIGPIFAIETHMTIKERFVLSTTALQLPSGFVACEIGSYVGASACFLAAAASLKQGKVHCVDTWDNRAMGAEKPRDTYAEFIQNTQRFQSYIIPHRGEAAAMANQVPAGLDLLFLDGDHSYEAVASDLHDYMPKLKPGGLLLIHDSKFESVQQALKEYFAGRSIDTLGTTHTLLVMQMPKRPAGG